MTIHPKAQSLSEKGVALAALISEVEILLLDPEMQDNEDVLRYLRSIARRSGELSRTVSACCYLFCLFGGA